MIYLTYNDLPSGIYQGQVIDVCKFLKKEFKVDIRLVALISIRGYWANRKKIKDQLPDAIVIPMIPKHRNWNKNKFLVKFALRKSGKQDVIGRGIFATNLALQLKGKGVRKVIFDGRGAYKAEFEEYLNKIVHVNEDIATLEKNAVMNTDQRIAVSNKLVEFWKRTYNYSKQEHVVIPCTLNSRMKSFVTEEELVLLNKQKKKNEIRLIYSGSAADWQSVEAVNSFLEKQLSTNEHINAVLLSRFPEEELRMLKKFPGRVRQTWLEPQQVHEQLLMADYGLLIRERSVTNEVASPVKFGEYLNAGLKVILSDGIGDFPEFVKAHDAGFVVENESSIVLENVSYAEKKRMHELAATYFVKEYFKSAYQKISS